MGITSVEKRAVIESAERAGARSVYLIEQPKAAALGAGLPINDPQGSLIVDIGGGTTDIACLSLQGVVTYETLRVAGDEFTAAITNYIKEHAGLQIGEQTAEKVKIAIGSAVPMEFIGGEEMQMEIRGRDFEHESARPHGHQQHSDPRRNDAGAAADRGFNQADVAAHAS